MIEGHLAADVELEMKAGNLQTSRCWLEIFSNKTLKIRIMLNVKFTV